MPRPCCNTFLPSGLCPGVTQRAILYKLERFFSRSLMFCLPSSEAAICSQGSISSNVLRPICALRPTFDNLFTGTKDGRRTLIVLNPCAIFLGGIRWPLIFLFCQPGATLFRVFRGFGPFCCQFVFKRLPDKNFC